MLLLQIQYKLFSTYNSQNSALMIYSRKSERMDCCEHLEEIALLQEKLMELHSKLIDQLDICSQQEVTIIQLNAQLKDQINHSFDTFQYQSFGQQSDASKENRTLNFKNNLSQSQNMKIQLLEADLAAMRNKVLSEITEKNMLKEEIKQRRIAHKKEMTENVMLLQRIKEQLKMANEENEKLRNRVQKAKWNQQQETQVQLLIAKANNFQRKYQQQRQNNQSLLEENQNCKFEIERLKKAINVKEAESMQRTEAHKRKGFEETKELIKKLQETEINVRKGYKHHS